MNRRLSILLIILGVSSAKAQYTDQINSNRPGSSIGAFSVGKNVIQAEAGLALRYFTHAGYNNSTFRGSISFLSLRWGFLFETLELTYEGQFLSGTLNSKILTNTTVYSRNGFLQNFIGLKYLLYDPFKKEKELNVYSWKANNGFKIKDLIPAVSLTLGGNLNLEENNPFPFNNVFGTLYRPVFFQNLGIAVDEEPFFHLRGTLATQSHFLGTWVFVTNFTYNRYLSKYPQKSYIITLTHTFDPLWSVYIENQPALKNPTMKTVQMILFSYFLINGVKDNTKSVENIVDNLEKENLEWNKTYQWTILGQNSNQEMIPTDIKTKRAEVIHQLEKSSVVLLSLQFPM